eukprot:3921444-Prymnesium_polylepis.1
MPRASSVTLQERAPSLNVQKPSSSACAPIGIAGLRLHQEDNLCLADADSVADIDADALVGDHEERARSRAAIRNVPVATHVRDARVDRRDGQIGMERE